MINFLSLQSQIFLVFRRPYLSLQLGVVIPLTGWRFFIRRSELICRDLRWRFANALKNRQLVAACKGCVENGATAPLLVAEASLFSIHLQNSLL